jgi:hypothetical protein
LMFFHQTLEFGYPRVIFFRHNVGILRRGHPRCQISALRLTRHPFFP